MAWFFEIKDRMPVERIVGFYKAFYLKKQRAFG
ncbi:hypothetical protein X474_04850 [Dethiosulfatarculus sandiegensis]|uniref:Uncharacterized protein n=1 Tax=Dethiosulfatarculus sandiegensis TaxID=1429043 RepID=A0A0D2K0D8_9BACT|nr:hypothetical protein X474_04850 [Dethiosulfatarculus sandiegensis]